MRRWVRGGREGRTGGRWGWKEKGWKETKGQMSVL